MSSRKTEDSTEDGRLRGKSIARWKNIAKNIPALSASRVPFTQTRRASLDGSNSECLKRMKRFGWNYSTTCQVDPACESYFKPDHMALACQVPGGVYFPQTPDSNSLVNSAEVSHSVESICYPITISKVLAQRYSCAVFVFGRLPKHQL